MVLRHSLCHRARKPRIARMHRARTSRRRLLVKMQTAPFRQAKTCKAPNGKHPSQTDKTPCNLSRIRPRARTNPVRPGRPRTGNPRPAGPGKTRNPRNLGRHSQCNLGKRSQWNLGRHSPRKRIVRHRGKPSPAQDNPRRVLPSPASRGNPPRDNPDRHSQPNLDRRSQWNLGKRSQPNRGRYSQRSPNKCSHLSLDSVRPVNPDKLSQGRASLLWLIRGRARASPAVAKVRKARASKPAPLSAHLWVRSALPGRPR